ncbi:type II toxin-antitoxin system RelE/ParE family toxin [Aquibium microcysteis]|uniref:type II toxin-antitoxin system RelE/ParE family toxin n=1 Tax=Aquibium microcysteis TaxID=675281 RepID=UPI001EF1DD3A|nr:type II toxin-antitoxin system RelE/ParE family toxin [Aquibium microcysteis]
MERLARLPVDKVRSLHTYEGMHTVSELNAFRRAAQAAGMSDEDIEDFVDHIAVNPDDGEEIVGTGGCRKVRFSIRGNNKGKSGGVRTITFFTGTDLPVFLITVFGKSQKVNLTKAERNSLKKLTEAIVEEYVRRVQPLTAGGERA